MGDELVDLVRNALRRVAFANGVSFGALHPIADVVVMRLEDGGISRERIAEIFADEAIPPATGS